MSRAMESMTTSPAAVEFGTYLHGALAERAGKLREAVAANEVGQRFVVARGSRMAALSSSNLEATYKALYFGDSAAAIRRIDSALAAVRMDSVPPRDRRPLWFADLYLAAHRADRLRALVAAQERDDPKGFDEFYVTSLPQLRGALARAEGRFADAVRHFREAAESGVPDLTLSLLATAFLEAGQKDSAIVYFERVVHSTSIDLSVFVQSRYLAPARQHLAELYEERGEFGKAYDLYAALAEQWRYADPELQPTVRRIRDRMRSLEKKKG
jgi:tetratricopeptide (TPR) repeat protein